MMQTGVFSTSSGYLRWRSPSERLTLPYITMEWDELAMGSWKLTAGTRHLSYEFVWDGREGVISVRGPFHAGQGSASASPSVVDEELGVPPSLEPFQYVQRFFKSRPNA